MADVTCTIELNRGAVFDEMCECLADLRELVELIPDYQQPEAIALAQKIAGRMTSWVSVSAEPGESQ